MSDLKYTTYPGFGEYVRENLGYSQSVRVDNRIECSGQGKLTYKSVLHARLRLTNLGGWYPELTSEGISFPKTLKEEIEQAFANVDMNLKNAGGKGWEQVYRVYSFHTEITPEVSQIMAENYRKYAPHGPIWTQIGVKQLGVPEMHVEIEVVALDK